MKEPSWGPWRPLDLRPAPDARVLAEILDGGQSFRWFLREGIWEGSWEGRRARVGTAAAGSVQWQALAGEGEDARAATERYFGTGVDLGPLVDSLPWRSDAHLKRCIDAFPGLRLLRQPVGETLLGYLCSSAKRIVQIKRMMGLMAERLGDPPCGLPSWKRLGSASQAQLRSCGLGFRARYVFETAQFLACRPGWLEETEALPYSTARERLCTLPGVGRKIADCVLLSGAGRWESFPVDTWVIKAMSRRYGLEGWSPEQINQFGRAHFGPLAGLAQQYLFAWERNYGNEEA